jgi:GTP cyclohydrolase I
VAYLPRGKVVGLSKLARVVEVFARRLQTQETLTRQVADSIVEGLNPLGVAVLITAEHQCMSTRGVRHQHVDTVTTTFTGVFKTDAELRSRFMELSKA